MSKVAAERNQRILLELASKPGNDVCADCRARAPRWASHNLGIFICVNCASIHRKIGTHITKVKSLTMDSWTREQVEAMKSNGNTTSNVKYNPDETRHPPPANREESERDSELEKYIRAKYEFKRFMTKIQNTSIPPNAVPNRQPTFPPVSLARQSSPLPPLPLDRTSTLPLPAVQPTLPAHNFPEQSTVRSSTLPSQHSPASVSLAPASSPSSAPAMSFTATPQPPSSHPVWGDIMSLTAPPRTTSFSMTPQEQPAMQQTSPASWAIPPYAPASGQPAVGSPFNQQQSMGSFQQGASNLMLMQPTFNQTSASVVSYNPYGQQHHTFMPSSYPSQFVQPQPVPEQMPTQANNPFGSSWQGFPGQNQYGGQWGSSM